MCFFQKLFNFNFIKDEKNHYVNHLDDIQINENFFQNNNLYYLKYLMINLLIIMYIYFIITK